MISCQDHFIIRRKAVYLTTAGETATGTQGEKQNVEFNCLLFVIGRHTLSVPVTTEVPEIECSRSIVHDIVKKSKTKVL